MDKDIRKTLLRMIRFFIFLSIHFLNHMILSLVGIQDIYIQVPGICNNIHLSLETTC